MLPRSSLVPARLGLSLLIALTVLPGGAAAQACLGGPLMGDQGPRNTLSAQVGLFDGGRVFGAEYTTSHGDPIVISLSAGGAEYDDIANVSMTTGAQVAVELPIPGISICPVAGVDYERLTNEFRDGNQPVDVTVSSISVPLALGIGRAIEGGAGTAFIPAVRGGLIWNRTSFAAASSSATTRGTENSTDFFVGGGATLLVSRFFLQASVARRVEDGAEAVFAFGLGVAF